MDEMSSEMMRSRRSLHAQVKEEERELRVKIAQTEIDELKQSLRYVEIQFAKSKEITAAVTQKLQESQREVKHLQEELRDQVHLAHTQSQQIKDLQLKLEDALSVHHDLSEKSQLKLDQAKLEANKREEDVVKMRAALQQKETQLELVTGEKQRLEQRLRDLEAEVEFKTKEFVGLQSRLVDKEKEVDDMLLHRQTNDRRMMEYQQLKTDNQRMLMLLKSTTEFKDFNIGGEETRRFVPLSAKSEAKMRPNKPRSQPSASTTDSNWIPTEAYKVAESFKQANNLSISNTQINKLLAELNLIWREREWKQLYTVKQEAALEIMSLRRQLALRLPFDAQKEGEEIRKLKAELRQTQVTAERLAAEEAYHRPVELLEYEPPKEENNEDRERAEQLEETLRNMVQSVGKQTGELKKTLGKVLVEFCENKERDIPALKKRARDTLLKKVGQLVDSLPTHVTSEVPLPLTPPS